MDVTEIIIKSYESIADTAMGCLGDSITTEGLAEHHDELEPLMFATLSHHAYELVQGKAFSERVLDLLQHDELNALPNFIRITNHSLAQAEGNEIARLTVLITSLPVLVFLAAREIDWTEPYK